MPPIALDVKDGVRGCAAIAFAVDADKWGDDSRFLATARSARDGAFDIRGLPAGDYFVTVADRVREDHEWHDPDVLNALARSAKRHVDRRTDRGDQLSTLKSQLSRIRRVRPLRVEL